MSATRASLTAREGARAPQIRAWPGATDCPGNFIGVEEGVVLMVFGFVLYFFANNFFYFFYLYLP
jgi:hypothetical protein